MIHTLREAFNELLAENHWMDDETRAVAKEKADAMNERIGYPEMLKDSEELSKEYVMVSNSSKHVSRDIDVDFQDRVPDRSCYSVDA